MAWRGAGVCWLLLSLCGAATAIAEESKPEPLSFVPLPVYATLPNEGATYGFMPVFLDSDRDTGRIWSIFAPSLTWNGVSRLTPTLRFYRFPNSFEEQIFQATYASRLFREVVADWNNYTRERGERTFNYSFQYRSDPYRRFYGLGQNTGGSDETSYTLRSLKFLVRSGYNLEDGVNVNAGFGFNRFLPFPSAVNGIASPFTHNFGTPGLEPANTFYALLGFKYDTRPLREYSTKGFSAEVTGGGALSNVALSGRYGFAKAEVKGLVEHSSRLYTAARAYWGYTYGTEVPFYEQQSLGGSFTMRGFILDRWIDRGAWTIDLEERFAAAIVHIEGTPVHFRIDPFLSIGQVYTGVHEIFDRIQFTQGIGFRGFVPPNVMGRIDIGRDDGKFNVYVELGYPF